MTELQRQAKEASDRLKMGRAWAGNSFVLDGREPVDIAIAILRQIERGELHNVVHCHECAFAKETAVIICRNPKSPCRSSFLKGHDYCSFGRRKSDVDTSNR